MANDRFPTTQWSLVLDAGEGSAQALNELCGRYRPPLLTYAKNTTRAPDEAEDLVQGFFAELLARDSLGVVEKRPDNSKFRSWLLTAFKHFRAKQFRRDRAEKYGGKAHLIRLDALDDRGHHVYELEDHMDSLALYERCWAETVLTNVESTLKEHYESRNESERFEVLKDLLWSKTSDVNYAERGRLLNMSKENVGVWVHRFRAKQKECIYSEVGRTVGNRDEIFAEIQYLISILARTS